MISVIIPTLDAEARIGAALAALVPATVEGLVRQVVIADGGSTDRTLAIVDQAGADLIVAAPGRGRQLIAGAKAARFPWLLFLHADTELAPGWEHEVRAYVDRVDRGRWPDRAAAFAFRLDDVGARPRVLETLVAVRCAVLRLPYGDQGLLVRRCLYDAIGGYRDLALMEDVDIVRRLGRRRVALLRSAAITSAVRYRRDGYLLRGLRNALCLALYAVGVPVAAIKRIYG